MRDACTPWQGNEVAHNTILNSVGAPEGTPDGGNRSAAIYFDHGTTGVKVYGNHVGRAAKAVHILSSFNLEFYDNTFFDAGVGVNMGSTSTTRPPIRNTRFDNNTFFVANPNQQFWTIDSNADDIASMATMSGNRYVTVADGGGGFNTDDPVHGDRRWDLPSWQAAFGKDAGSVVMRHTAPLYTVLSEGANRVANGTFDAGTTGIGGTMAVTLESAGQLTTGPYVKAVAPSPAEAISFAAGDLVAGKSYLLRFTAKGANASPTALEVLIRERDGTKLAREQLRTLTNQAGRYEMLFTARADLFATRMHLRMWPAGGTVYLDNIEFREASVTPRMPFRAETNWSAQFRTVLLDADYVDTRGTTYSGNATVPPFGSLVMMRR
jgi:hypothetical protein